MAKKPALTQEQAQLLVDAHEVAQLMDNEEEVELLKENNPEMLDAYRALLAIANP